MPAPGVHKTVQARILQYAQEIGWVYVPRMRPNEGGLQVFRCATCEP
jgi:hypothetical protein